jgi:hypothetical protein
MLPNKVVTFPESLIWYFPDILEAVSECDIGVEDLWGKMESKIVDINTFFLCSDALYTLGKLEYMEKYGVIKYVKEN